MDISLILGLVAPEYVHIIIAFSTCFLDFGEV